MKKLFKKIGLELVAASAGVFLILLFLLGIFSNLQVSLVDNLYGGKETLNNIVIVAIDDASIQEVGRWPWDRSHMAKVIDGLNGSSLIVVDIGFFENSTDLEDEALANSIRTARNVILAFESLHNGKIMEPIPIIKKYSLDTGYANIIVDSDGTARSINPNLILARDPMSVSAYNHHLGKNWTYPKDRFLIDFAGGKNSFEYISAADIIFKRVNASIYADKIVFVGATANDLHDYFLVPTSKSEGMPGVEIHAHALQAMINKKELNQVSNFFIATIILIFSILAGSLTKLKYKFNIPILIIAIISYILSCILMFENSVILNIIYPPLALILGYIFAIGYNYIFEKQEKKKVVAAFGKYVSPVVVEQIMKDPEKLKLGGEKRTITLLFSDINGFTTLSESLEAEKLVQLLNDFLSKMTAVIMRNNGLVDKYMGDAIMAFWNAPLVDKDHARNACNASLEMVKTLKELQNKSLIEKTHSLNMGIGIHTGSAVVGNMGSYERFDYTAIGDSVNLTSRLEGLTKFYSVNVIISQSTYNLVHDEFLCRKIDKVAVKGKKEGVVIYELICKSAEANEAQKELIQNFQQALDLYFKKEFKNARAIFMELEKKGDITAKEFSRRCTLFMEKAPEHSWDGSWIMESK